MLCKCFILCSILLACDGYKLLVFFPVPGKSHSILGEGFVRHLMEAGHEVTYVTPIPTKNPPHGLRQIDVSENAKVLSPDIFDVMKILRKELNLQDYVLWFNVMMELTNVTLNTRAMQDFLMDPKERYDAVIVEWLFSELGAGLATVFNCPLIWSSSMAPHTHVLSLINENLNPAYTFTFLSTKYSFGFFDRVSNLWELSMIGYHTRQMLGTEVEIYKQVFGPAAAVRGQTLPELEEVRYNGSFMFGNSHFSVGDIIALPQNYKDIGGYHIQPDIDPLPENLQKIMDNATDGVIYFSLGSMLQANKIPMELKRRFLDMFGELKQAVIWKLGETLSDIPKNVHVVSWAPQQSILAHPNCVLFVTHAGLLSITEAIYFGVPVIGMPFFADQYLNIERAVSRGFAKRLDLSFETPEQLKEVISEMITHPSYRQRAKEWSSMYHDKIISPGKEIVFWVEHVVKSGGAPHLRSIALKMEWYNKFYVDFAAVLLLLTIASYYVLRHFFATNSITIRKKKTA